MKSIKMIAGFLTCLMLQGWSYEEALAESTWTSKCSSYGDMKPNQNPTFQHMNCLLTNAALEANIPPEVVKAVASKENGGWKQFDENGLPVISKDNGIGIMQITNQSDYDQEKLKYDINYNIQAGVEILNRMYHNRTDLPKIKGAGSEVIENWYFPVMAYNGIKPVNSPLYQSSGLKNIEAYQEKVFAFIEKDSYLNGTRLGQFSFDTADFEYDPTSSENVVFKKKEYTLTDQLHTSAYRFQKGDKVLITEDAVKLRSQPSTSSVARALAKNTILIIEGNFVYDQSLTSINQFVWYPVKTEDQKFVGYISSAYITKKLDVPAVKVMWGKTELKLGQIGKVTILTNTNLVKLESDGSLTTVRPLKKGEEYRVYSYKSNHEGLYGVGGGNYVQKSTKVKYETPSKSKLALLSQQSK